MNRVEPMSQTTSDSKSPLSKYVRDLANPDVEKRRRAIMKLGQTADPEALKPLGDVYRSDPSVELRELARKAGVYIRQQEQAAAERAAGPQPTAKRVSPSDIQRARGYTDEALTLNLEGHNEKAVKSLSKALSINPSLVEDTYFTGMASVILDLPKDQALELLKNAEQRGEFAKTVTTQRKTAAVEEHMQEAKRFTWRGTSLDLILYALICALGPVIVTMVIAQAAQQVNALTAEESCQSGYPRLCHPVHRRDWHRHVVFGPAPDRFRVRDRWGWSTSSCRPDWYIWSHDFYCAVRAPLATCSGKLVPLFSRYLLIVCLVASLAIGIGAGAGAFFLVYAAAVGIVLFSLFTVVKMFGSVAEAYHFGAGMGCVSILLASIGLAVLNGVMIALLSQTLTGLLSGFVTPA